MKKVFEKTFAS